MNRDELIGLINEAINGGQTPVVHPNGFIQLSLLDGRRMHFWDKSIPRQKVPTLIHDHVFDMESEIIAGTLLHRNVRVHGDPDGFYDIYEAKTVEGVETKLVPIEGRVRADHSPWQVFEAGDVYTFKAARFHETSDRDGPCISIITKGETYDEIDPRVLIPHGQKPDNDFKRSFDLIKLVSMIDVITNELRDDLRPHKLFPL